MTKEIIEKLPDLLKKHICTLKRASMDDSRTLNMCESSLMVINFDRIPNEYCRGKGWANVPNSNDALYITRDNKWYFVEFKNGEVVKSNVYRKIYDSLIMLIELDIIADLNFARNNINYILVYNSNKYNKVGESKSRDDNYSYFMKLAKKEEKLFDIEKFEKYLLKETHTYTKETFENEFVIPMEISEGIIAV